MTENEHQAVSILCEMVKTNERSNVDAHKDILERISDLERRLCRKIEELRVLMLEHCKEQESELEERRDMFEAAIAEAEKHAVQQATQPTVIHQAGVLVGRRVWRVLVGLAFLVGFASTIIVILRGFGIG